MELIRVPRGTFIRIKPQSENESVHVPPGMGPMETDTILYFDHIDGMYSLCFTVNGTIENHDLKANKEQPVHIAAWTEVEILSLEEIIGDFEEIRKVIGRSGYGKDGKGEYRETKLSDMSDDWVKNSIEYVKYLAPGQTDHLKYYEMELEYRAKHNITIVDEEDDKENFAQKQIDKIKNS